MQRSNVSRYADSLIVILTEQCAELESLLALARRETDAASANDFEEVMRIVEERATIGERLEVYHRQIAELRGRLGEANAPSLKSDIARRTVRLALEVQSQDALTRPLLVSLKDKAMDSLARVVERQRGSSAYLRDAPPVPVACDRRI